MSPKHPPVRSPVPGQLQTNAVLRTEGAGNLPVDFCRFVVKPEQTRRRVARIKPVLQMTGQTRRIQRVINAAHLSRRTLVELHDGRISRLQRFLRGNQSVHLPGESDDADGGKGFGLLTVQHLQNARPPRVRVFLGISGSRPQDRYSCPADARMPASVSARAALTLRVPRLMPRTVAIFVPPRR